VPVTHSNARTIAIGYLSAVLVVVALVCPRLASADATVVDQWGSEGSGDGQFSIPSDLAVGSGGSIYVADSANNRIQKFTASGAFVTKWGASGSGDGEFGFPQGVATNAAGDVYVADSVNGRVQEFTADGAFIRQWGTAGSEDGQFSNPLGIAIDGAGSVYVADNGNSRVQKFTADGQFITKWGSSGSGDGEFGVLFGLEVDRTGNVYVPDGNNRIEKFSSAGAFITKWGTLGNGDGQLSFAFDVAVAPDGNVAVADGGNGRIQTFTPDGAFVSKFDRLEPGSQTFLPRAVAAEPGGDLYILDLQAGGLNRVLRVRGVALPAPVVAKTVNVAPASGKVFVSVPARGAFASVSVPGIKGRRFVPLTEARQLPVGAIVDTRKGSLSLTSASTAAGKSFSGTFSAGVFTALQSRSGLTDLPLKGSSFRPCARAAGKKASAALSKRTIRRIHANAKGRFRTRGRYSAATVRGTEWDTIDRCDGTLTKVKRGVVVVRDNRKHRNITVRAGKSYLARAPG
jgi:DNA-binding beta-propeller fold protein YncE